MLWYKAKKYCHKINFCFKYLKGKRVSSKALKAAFFIFAKYNSTYAFFTNKFVLIYYSFNDF